MKKWVYLFTLSLALWLLFHSQPVLRAQSAPTLAVVPDKMVTLTFDDGPDPRYTLPILDLLKEYDVKGTFFVVGENALTHPDIIERIDAEGHSLANHTLTHPHLEQLSAVQVRAELEGADAAITAILGPARAPLHDFRPPRGKISPEIRDAVDALQKEMVLWNVCVENSATHTPEEVRARVMKLVRERGGGILLAHDGELDRTLTVQALPLILADLQREGYHIVSLDEYLQAQRAKSARTETARAGTQEL